MTDSSESRGTGEGNSSKESIGTYLGSGNELEIGFCGNPRAKLDERGRLKMPAEFKAFIERKYGKDFNEFYITSREGQDAEIFPLPEWQQHMAKVFRMPASHPARKDLLARYSLYGGRADMDPQGRLLIPEELRNAGMVSEDVSVTGEGTLLRVTVVSRLKESVQGKPLAAQNADALTAFGL